jgi:RNA polymerase sigma-70 factor (ECF subfamily)
MRETRALARLRDQHVRHIEVSEPGEEIWEAIASLPTRQAQVIVLVVLQDLHIDDVSALLGCGPETVRTHLRRGRATLAELLAQETP